MECLEYHVSTCTYIVDPYKVSSLNLLNYSWSQFINYFRSVVDISKAPNFTSSRKCQKNSVPLLDFFRSFLSPPSWEMTSVCGTSVSAPSAALLRFLRSQSYELCFFNSCLELSLCHDSSNPSPTRSFKKGADVIRSISRNIDAYRRRDATCEASVLNFDISSHRSARNAHRSLKSSSESQRRILENNIPYGRSNQTRQVSALFGRLLRNPWGPRRANQQATSKPDDLTEPPSFLDDVSEAMLGRSKVVEASNGMKLRGTELNEKGAVTLVNGQFKKSELILKVSVTATTLRMKTRN